MAAPTSHRITGLAQSWCVDEEFALDPLVPLIEAELHRLAHRYLAREHHGHILQTTALVTSFREWNQAKASLYYELSGGGGDDA